MHICCVALHQPLTPPSTILAESYALMPSIHCTIIKHFSVRLTSAVNSIPSSSSSFASSLIVATALVIVIVVVAVTALVVTSVTTTTT